MAKWRERKKPEEKNDHKQLVAMVKQLRSDNKPEYERMDRAMQLYTGRLWNLEDNEFIRRDAPQGRSDVQFNTIFANIEQTAPLVTASRPITTVVPKKPYLEPLAISMNHVLKWMWEAFDMQMLMYKAVKDQMIFGTALFKIWYNPDKAGGGNIDISLLDPRNFGPAPGYDEIKDMPFYCIWDRKPISWVERNFPDVKNIKPDEGENDNSGPYGPQRAYKFGDISDNMKHTKFVTVYEVWTRDDDAYESFITEDDDTKEKKTEKKKKYPYGKICFFTEHQMLGYEACNDKHGMPPVVELHDYIRPHNFLALSEVDETEGLHKEINALLKYVSEYIRKFHDPNFLVDISQLGDETYEGIMDKLSEGGQYFPWDSTGDKSPPIIQVNEGELNDLILPYMSFLMNLIDVVSGVTDVKRGMVGKKERQSASELAMLNEAGDTRTNQRTRNLEWSLKRIFKMMLQLAQQYYNEPRDINYSEDGGRVYENYGNSYAQAAEKMQPKPMSPQAQMVAEGKAPHTQKNDAEIQRYEREAEDEKKFVEFFKDDEGNLPSDFDPIEWDFDIEIQSDSTLPTDRQSRANQGIALRKAGAMDVLSLLEILRYPDAKGIAERVAEEKNGGKQEQMMQQVQQMMAQKKGGPQ